MTVRETHDVDSCYACPVCHDFGGWTPGNYHCDLLKRKVPGPENSPPDDCPARGDGVTVVYTIRARDYEG